MKAKRVLAVLLSIITTAALSITASAAKLTDLVYPSESDPAKNDAYYALSASGYFVSKSGNFYSGEETGIDSEGNFFVEYKISPLLADNTMSGKGALEEMGVMIHNVDRAFDVLGIDYQSVYPVDLLVSDAKFVAEDGTETVFNDILNITEIQRDMEGDIALRIRPTNKVDEESGEVLVNATRETEGWDEEGAFIGGTLYFSMSLGSPKKDEVPPSASDSYKIGIKDYTEETAIGYKEERIFTADCSNLPEGAEIRWFVNGQCACTGSSCTVKDPTDDYTVQAKLIDNNGNVLAESDVINVKVKNTLFAKIWYFLMTVYSALIGAITNVVNK